MAKFRGIPTKIIGGVRITPVGDGPVDVNNRRAHLHLGILEYSDEVLIARYTRASLAPVQKLHISPGKTNAVPT